MQANELVTPALDGSCALQCRACARRRTFSCTLSPGPRSALRLPGRYRYFADEHILDAQGRAVFQLVWPARWQGVETQQPLAIGAGAGCLLLAGQLDAHFRTIRAVVLDPDLAGA